MHGGFLKKYIYWHLFFCFPSLDIELPVDAVVVKTFQALGIGLVISLVIILSSMWNASPRAIIANALRYRLFEGQNSIIANAHNSRMIYELVTEQFDLFNLLTTQTCILHTSIRSIWTFFLCYMIFQKLNLSQDQFFLSFANKVVPQV